jgi:hypothetical protein
MGRREEMIGRGIFTLLAVTLMTHSAAVADVMTFTPEPANLDDLDHHWVYIWGIDVPLDPTEVVIAAELTFYNIRNWDENPNILYIHQLDWAELGVQQIYDDQGGGDYFATTFSGEHTHLVTYEDLPTQPQNLTYSFAQDDLAVLNGYLADERVGLGLDPDCHFFNDGVELTLEVIPEPASLVLLGLSGLALLRRR